MNPNPYDTEYIVWDFQSRIARLLIPKDGIGVYSDPLRLPSILITAQAVYQVETETWLKNLLPHTVSQGELRSKQSIGGMLAQYGFNFSNRHAELPIALPVVQHGKPVAFVHEKFVIGTIPGAQTTAETSEDSSQELATPAETSTPEVNSQQGIRKQRVGVIQYYYKDPDCRAKHSGGTDCVCWTTTPRQGINQMTRRVWAYQDVGGTSSRRTLIEEFPLEVGEWKLISPSGKVFSGKDPVSCVVSECNVRIPAEARLARMLEVIAEHEVSNRD